MFWFSAIGLIFLATTSILTEIEAGKPSVHYIRSVQGNFFMAPYMTFNKEKALHVTTYDVTNCSCKALCRAVIPCKAWSVVKFYGGKVECRLAKEGPTIITPRVYINATYFFKEDSIDGTYSFQKGDNLLYVDLNTLMYFDPGNKTCRDIPGHRMMIVKTEVQYQYFKSLWFSLTNKYVAVDLMKVVTGTSTELVWGDGTPYSATEMQEDYLWLEGGSDEDIFCNLQGRFNDYVRFFNFKIICQANPLGVEW